MNVFYEEVHEKALLARSARHRYRPPRTPRINNISEARWRKMNGDITSIQLGKPMKWHEFKALPQDYQMEYINNLVGKYNAGATALAEMFGVTGTTCSKYLKGGLGVTLPNYSSAKQREKFMKDFCRIEPDSEQASVEPPVAEPAPAAAPKPKAMMLTKTTLSFSGEYNAKLIADKLAALFDNGVNVTVTIDIQMTE